MTAGRGASRLQFSQQLQKCFILRPQLHKQSRLSQGLWCAPNYPAHTPNEAGEEFRLARFQPPGETMAQPPPAGLPAPGRLPKRLETARRLKPPPLVRSVGWLWHGVRFCQAIGRGCIGRRRFSVPGVERSSDNFPPFPSACVRMNTAEDAQRGDIVWVRAPAPVRRWASRLERRRGRTVSSSPGKLKARALSQ